MLCFFEPGDFHQNVEKACPEQIPAKSRAHMNTPLGLLFNELLKSPDTILRCINLLLDNILELDTGRYDAGSSSAILYVIRLYVRIEAYIRIIVDNYLWKRNSAGNILDNSTVNGKAMSYIRGLECSEASFNKFDTTLKEWKVLTLKRIFPMLLGWIRRGTIAGDDSVLCILRAHLALLFNNIGIKLTKMDEKNASPPNMAEQLAIRTIVCSHVYLTATFRFDIEPRLGEVVKEPLRESIDEN